jgi:hypothetical protein
MPGECIALFAQQCCVYGLNGFCRSTTCRANALGFRSAVLCSYRLRGALIVEPGYAGQTARASGQL